MSDPAVTTSADGVVHIVAEYEMPDAEQEEQPDAPTEATEALKGAGRAVLDAAGKLWDLIKPDDPSLPETEEE